MNINLRRRQSELYSYPSSAGTRTKLDGWREMPDENDEKRLSWWFGKAQEEHDEVVDTHSNILCTNVIIQFLLYAPLTFFAELSFQVPNYLHIYDGDGRLR